MSNHTIKNLIGQDTLWNQLMTLMDVPEHIFISGPPGSGKSHLIRNFLQHYMSYKKISDNSDFLFILGSEQDRGIQSIRNKLLPFIRQKSIKEGIYNWVLIDDVDSFSSISQQALRRTMELYRHITRIIFIGNSQDDVIPSIKSRCICLSMNRINIPRHITNICDFLTIPKQLSIDYETLVWLTNATDNNMKSIFRILKLSNSIFKYYNNISINQIIKLMCSVPLYLDFYSIIHSLINSDIPNGIIHLIKLWKSGYTYEDIIDGIASVKNIETVEMLSSNVIINIFLINAWISYTKGETSLLSLQYVYYKTIKDCNSNKILTEEKYLTTVL